MPHGCQEGAGHAVHDGVGGGEGGEEGDEVEEGSHPCAEEFGVDAREGRRHLEAAGHQAAWMQHRRAQAQEEDGDHGREQVPQAYIQENRAHPLGGSARVGRIAPVAAGIFQGP